MNPTSGPSAYIRTEYAYIRTYAAALHAAHSDDIDLFLHLGMAGWDFVSVEERAYKQGFSSDWAGERVGGGEYYMLPDAAGGTVVDAGKGLWDGVPVGLGCGVAVGRVVEGAREVLEREEGIEGYVPVKSHHEAGSYCCGFLFYESLANRYTKGTRGQVMFCHVPADTDAASLERARNSVLAVVGAAAGLLDRSGGR